MLIGIIKDEIIKGRKSWFMNPLLFTKNDEKKPSKPRCNSHKGVVNQICTICQIIVEKFKEQLP